MAGLFASGGFIDHLFDLLRSELGSADTAIQEWFKDKLKQDTDRYAVQRVLWVYGQGVKNGTLTAFEGVTDPNAKKTVEYVVSFIGLEPVFVYNVLFACHELAKTDKDCASVLAGQGSNFFDDLMNGGAVTAATNTVNATFAGLGLPSVANTVVLLAVVAVVGGIVYLKWGRK